MASVWWVTNGVEHLGCFVIAPDASEAKLLARRSFLAHLLDTEPRTGECWSRLAATCCGPADPGWRSKLVDARGPVRRAGGRGRGRRIEPDDAR
jgi:hypothetical protein